MSSPVLQQETPRIWSPLLSTCTKAIPLVPPTASACASNILAISSTLPGRARPSRILKTAMRTPPVVDDRTPMVAIAPGCLSRCTVPISYAHWLQPVPGVDGAAQRDRVVEVAAPRHAQWAEKPGVPGNTAHYDDRAILSGHLVSLRWPLVSSCRR